MNREEKKKLQRHNIMSCAVQLFEKQGYEETSVQQIANEAGVSKGTFFNYFHTKEDVLYDLQGEEVLLEIHQILLKPGPIAIRLKACLLEMVKNVNFSRSLVRGMLVGTLRNPKYNQCSDQDDPLIQALIPVFTKGQETLEFSTTIPPQMMAQLFSQQYFGALISWAMGKGDDHLSSQMMITLELFFSGIEAGKK